MSVQLCWKLTLKTLKYFFYGIFCIYALLLSYCQWEMYRFDKGVEESYKSGQSLVPKEGCVPMIYFVTLGGELRAKIYDRNCQLIRSYGASIARTEKFPAKIHAYFNSGVLLKTKVDSVDVSSERLKLHGHLGAFIKQEGVVALSVGASGEITHSY